MFDWDNLKVFLSAYREGSIGRAAQALGMSATTVSRRLSVLEESLGQPLFVRSPEGLIATEAGRAAHSAAEDAERSAARIETLLGDQDEPRGTVRVALSNELLHAVLVPHWFEFSRRYPELSVDFVESTGLADLERWEADIAIRPVRPETGDELVVTKLRQSQAALFGAKRLLEAQGVDPSDPGAIEDATRAGLEDWPWVDWTPDCAHLNMPRLRQHLYPDARVVFRSSNMETLRVACAAGIGLMLLPGYFGLVSPTLVRLPAVGMPPPQTIYLVSHGAIRHTARVDAVWTHLADLLRGDDESDLARGREAITAAYNVVFDEGRG